jgi:hypothetical protein
MNKLLTTLFFIYFLSNAYAQDNFSKLPNAKGKCVTVIISENIIANEKAIETNKKMISEMSVLKLKPNRIDHKFYNLTAKGIVFVVLNKETAFKTQSEINKFFGLNKNNPVYVDGYLLEHSEYKIAINSIVEMEIVAPDADNKLENRVINVWSITKKERIEGCTSSKN